MSLYVLCSRVPPCHVGEAVKWLQADFFLPPPPPSQGQWQKCRATTMAVSFLPGKEVWGGGVFGRGAIGVYLSHGNWFAGVEVGSFEKTSFSLTPSHLSVWKAAGGRMERAREGMKECCCRGIFIQRLEKLSISEGWIWCQPKMKDTLFCVPPNRLPFFILQHPSVMPHVPVKGIKVEL